ncbi:MAG: hypothetical protein K9L78_04255 [Victivallales bacterium]|nr:hypothetical protein [Victivallales bacterium]MCF7889315.1 hypothetical protein [Victivallales bacterium]
MKSIFTKICCLTVFLIPLSLFAEEKPLPVTVQELKKISPSTTQIPAKVEPTASGNLLTMHPGRIVYVASIGDIVYSHVKDEHGNIIRKGSPVAIQDTSYKEKEVEQAKLALTEALTDLKLAQENFERDKKLVKSSAVSVKQMQTTTENYQSAKINVVKCETALKEAREHLENCYIYPDYTGQVQEVYATPGEFMDKHKKVAKVTILNPVYAKLKLPITLTDKINIENEVNVYTEGSEKPEKGVLAINPTDPTIVNVLFTNRLIDMSIRNLNPEEQKLPVVTDLRFVGHIYGTKKMFEKGEFDSTKINLGVPQNAIKKDEKGYFVWKAEGQRGITGKINYKFKIKKVYVTPGDITRDVTMLFNLSSYYRSIKKCDNLKPLSIIIPNPPKNVKDGDMVIYKRTKWKFSINQKVWIVIKGLSSPGIYVPENSVFDIYFGQPKVCLVKDGKIEYAKVNLKGYHDHYVKITGPKIKEGEQVLIHKDNIFKEIYDGRKVKVTDQIRVPHRLSKDVITIYNPIKSCGHKNPEFSAKSSLEK